MTKRFDIAIIGGGIAGASLAAEVAPHASVVILEGEDAAGYHSTGRSAAFWSETYGGPYIQPLTSASGEAIAPYLSVNEEWMFNNAGGAMGAMYIIHASKFTYRTFPMSMVFTLIKLYAQV